MNDTRPAKRIRQACEQCRRKKGKCSGERPVCSTCWRLEQQCYYYGEPLRPTYNTLVNVQGVNTESYIPTPMHLASSPQNLDNRMVTLETTVNRILGTMHSSGVADQFCDHQQSAPDVHSVHDNIGGTPLPPLTAIIGSQPVSRSMRLARGKEIEDIGQTYLSFCADQPLPLFSKEGFVESLLDRADSTLFGIIANSLRYNSAIEGDLHRKDSQTFRDAAHSRAMADVGHGQVGLPTLQTLCLIAFFDFTNGHMKTASSLLALTSMLASNVDFRTNFPATTDSALEECRCCYWSITLFRRFLGMETPLGTLLDAESLPYPKSSSMPTGAVLRPEIRQTYEQSKGDNGVMVFAMEMSQEWVRVMSYVKDCLSFTPDLSPWLTTSRYAAALSGVMSIETRLQPLHRYKHVTFRDLTLKDLEGRRQYWAPWLLSRFLYHTMICLLNHPLLITLQLQAKGNDSELFRQQSSFYVARHVHWILHFIAFIEARSFRVTDPIIGYCASVVATIESQLIYSVDEVTAQKKRRNIESCRRLIRHLSSSNASMVDLDRKLGALNEAISATYTSNLNNTASVSVDLSRIRDILDICPASFTNSTVRPDRQESAAQRTVSSGLSPPQWVRLSRRPSVDQPDDGGPPPQDDSQNHIPDSILAPQTLTDIAELRHVSLTQDHSALMELPDFTADLFFNGISQDVSSWWDAFETYDPDRPSF